MAKYSLDPMVHEGKAGWRVRDGAGKAVEEEVADMPVRKRKKPPLLLREGHGMLHLESDCFLDNRPQNTSGWGGP